MRKPARPVERRALAAAVCAAALPAVALLASGCGGGSPARPGTTTITVTPPPSTPGTSTPPASTTKPPVAAPTTYDQALTHFAAAQVDAAVKSTFTSPSGNIYCDIGADGASNGCELKAGRIPPPTVGYCNPGGGGGGGAKDIGRVAFGAGGPKAICNTDTILKPGTQPVLKYGSISRIDGSPLQCVSESIGMTCVNTAQKKGFFLARDKFFIF